MKLWFLCSSLWTTRWCNGWITSLYQMEKTRMRAGILPWTTRWNWRYGFKCVGIRLEKVLLQWLQTCHNEDRYGPPTWNRLANAVEWIDRALSITIRNNHCTAMPLWQSYTCFSDVHLWSYNMLVSVYTSFKTFCTILVSVEFFVWHVCTNAFVVHFFCGEKSFHQAMMRSWCAYNSAHSKVSLKL